MSTAYYVGQIGGELIVVLLSIWGVKSLIFKFKCTKSKVLCILVSFGVLLLCFIALAGIKAAYKSIQTAQTNTETAIISPDNITIYIKNDNKNDIELFTKELFTAIETKIPNNDKEIFNEALAFISFSTCKYQKRDIKYYTVFDFYSVGLTTIYKIAKNNNNKLRLTDILLISEKIKSENPTFWKEYTDLQDNTSKDETMARLELNEDIVKNLLN